MWGLSPKQAARSPTGPMAKLRVRAGFPRGPEKPSHTASDQRVFPSRLPSPPCHPDCAASAPATLHPPLPAAGPPKNPSPQALMPKPPLHQSTLQLPRPCTGPPLCGQRLQHGEDPAGRSHRRASGRATRTPPGHGTLQPDPPGDRESQPHPATHKHHTTHTPQSHATHTHHTHAPHRHIHTLMQHTPHTQTHTHLKGESATTLSSEKRISLPLTCANNPLGDSRLLPIHPLFSPTPSFQARDSFLKRNCLLGFGKGEG